MDLKPFCSALKNVSSLSDFKFNVMIPCYNIFVTPILKPVSSSLLMIFAEGWNVRSECGKAGQPDRCRCAGIFLQYHRNIIRDIQFSHNIIGNSFLTIFSHNIIGIFSQHFLTISSAFSHNIIRDILKSALKFRQIQKFLFPVLISNLFRLLWSCFET